MTRKELGGLIIHWIGFVTFVAVTGVAVTTEWPFTAWISVGAAAFMYWRIKKIKGMQADYGGDGDDER